MLHYFMKHSIPYQVNCTLIITMNCQRLLCRPYLTNHSSNLQTFFHNFCKSYIFHFRRGQSHIGLKTSLLAYNSTKQYENISCQGSSCVQNFLHNQNLHTLLQHLTFQQLHLHRKFQHQQISSNTLRPISQHFNVPFLD